MKSPNRRTGTAPRTGTRRRLLATGALLAIGVLPLSACSLFNPPLERDESVHAVFDAGQDIVKMPLDEYMYFETNNYAHTAFQIAMKQCFAEHGQNYTIQAPYSESAPRGDLGRKYGPWNVEYAQKYGLQKRDPNAAPISFNSGESMSPEDKLRIECYDKARETLDAAVPEGKRKDNDTTQPTYIRLENEAGKAVYGSDLHKELEEKWKQCVSNRGLTPNRAGSVAEETPMFDQMMKNGGPNAPASEEEIRIATIQAECNQQVGMSQQLYDLEAQYQMPLIRKYQTQLEQERNAERERDEKFKQYVLEHQ